MHPQPRQRDLFPRPAPPGAPRTIAFVPPPGVRALRALRRHALAGFLVLLLSLAAGWAACFWIQPVYPASALVELPPADAASTSALAATPAASAAATSLAAQNFAQELASRDLVLSAAAKFGPALPLHWFRPPLRLPAPPPSNALLTQAALRQLEISVLPQTQIVSLQFTAPSPALAAGFLRELLTAWNARADFSRRANAQLRIALLQSQSAAALARMNGAQTALATLAAQHGLADPAAQLSLATARWQQLAAAETGAEIAAFRASGDLGHAAPLSGAASLDTDTLAPLELQRATVAAQLARLAAQYRPQAAPLLEARQQLASLDAALAAARARRRQAAAASLAAVRQQARDLQTALARQARRQAGLRDALASFDSAQRALAADQSVYSNLLDQLGEALAAAGSASLRLRLVDAPQSAPLPLRPRLAQSLAAAFVLGLVLAALVIALLELADDRLRLPEAAELGVPLLAALRGKADPAALELCAAALLRAQADRGLAVIHVTSAEAGAGKSCFARDLASLLASLGVPVLLLDGSRRHPSLHRLPGLDPDLPLAPGLAELLAGHATVEQVLRRPSSASAASLITAGDASTCIREPSLALQLASGAVADLLAAARQRHDWVVIDGDAVADGPEAGLWAALADCSLVVARHARSRRRALRRALDALETSGAACLGLVLDRAPARLATVPLAWIEASSADTAVSVLRQRAS